MLKMGYKAGQALGKQSSNEREEKKLLEPIGIKLKTDREGLGKQHEKQQQMLEAERVRSDSLKLRAESEESRAKMYLNKKKSEFTLRKSRHNLHKCQRVCFQLDSTRGGLMEPKVKWFWPVSVRRSLKRQKEKFDTRNKTLSKNEKPLEKEMNVEVPMAITSTVQANQRMDYLEKIIDTQMVSTTSNVKTIYEKRLSEFLQEGPVEQPLRITQEEEEEREVEEENGGEDVEPREQLDTEQLRKEKQANEDEEMSERESDDNHDDDDDDEEKDENEQDDEQVILISLLSSPNLQL